jgi:predicted acylesterase/phospholipase RssA
VPIEERQLHNLFQLIGGTSAGGLNALTVGVLKEPASEIVKLAAGVANALHPTNFSWIPIPSIFSAIISKPTTEMLEAILKVVLKEHAFMGRTGIDPYIFVTTVQLMKGDKVIIGETVCNFDVPGRNKSSDWKAWEVGRITSAAPPYFEPFFKDRRKYRDGGIAANNPTFEALDLMAKLKQDVNILVSIGTGTRADYDEISTRETMFTLPGKVIDWLTETESTHAKVHSFCGSKSVHYFRFQPELPSNLLKIHLTANEARQVILTVERYLKEEQVQDDIKRLANLLIANQSTRHQDFLIPNINK